MANSELEKPAFQATEIPGCYVTAYPRHEDARGVFIKPFALAKINQLGLDFRTAETFFSYSNRGVLRGLHFQTPPDDHDKIVCCMAGQVLDVILDLRVGSPTFAKVACFELDGRKPQALFIPKGLAHGFFSHEDNSLMAYWVNTGHSPQSDAGIRWDSIDFRWPTDKPILSDRDARFVGLAEFNSPFRFE